MADDGAVKRGSGETTTSRLELVTLRASVAHVAANAREGWDGKGLEQHGHVRSAGGGHGDPVEPPTR